MTRSIDTQRDALLHNPESLPLHVPDSVASLGPTLVFAPHPDDESLGCGGVIALLREREIPVRVVVVSDGCGSHPNSLTHGPDVLRALREAEAVAALEILGVDATCVTFLRLPDTNVPNRVADAFHHVVVGCREVFALEPHPETVLLPWRRDPHRDHRATWDIVTAALRGVGVAPRVLEYPIWLWDLGDPGDAPMPEEVDVWRLDISPVLERKKAAIAAHNSQTTRLIADDPHGFMLAPATLERFCRPWEIFLEPRP